MTSSSLTSVSSTEERVPERDPMQFPEQILEILSVRMLLFLWLALFAAWPIFQSPHNGGTTPDWQFFQLFDEVARRTILEYKQFPIWNPYFCGGTTMVGNPQTTFLVPTFPLVLFFGTTFGMRVSSLVVLIVGCEGGYRLLRHLGARPWPCMLAAISYTFFARTSAWFTYGQHGLHAMTLAPWVFYGYIRGLEKPAYLVLGAAFFSWVLAYRGIEPGPQLAVALVVWAVLESRQRWLRHRTLRAALWPIAAGAVIGMLGAGFIGIRMLPVMDLVLHYPRIQPENRMLNLTDVFLVVFGIHPLMPGWRSAGYAYIGAVPYLLCVGAALFSKVRQRAARPLGVGLIFCLIMLGHHGPASPYHLLKLLPLYRSLRNPGLYSFAAAFFLVMAGALCLDEMDRWFRAKGGSYPRISQLLCAGLVVGTALELSLWMRHEIAAGPRPPIPVFSFPVLPDVDQEFRQARGNSFLHPVWPYQNRGTLSCYDETPFPASRNLRPDLPTEEYLQHPAHGTVERLRWTPNRIWLRATLSAPDTVIINQNFQPGWRTSAGSVHDEGGLVAIDLPAGETVFSIWMWPNLATWGLVAMALSIASAIWLLRTKPSRTSTAGA